MPEKTLARCRSFTRALAVVLFVSVRVLGIRSTTEWLEDNAEGVGEELDKKPNPLKKKPGQRYPEGWHRERRSGCATLMGGLEAKNPAAVTTGSFRISE
jgi:hypothetical protein